MDTTTPAAEAAAPELTFEAALARLESIVSEMEAGRTSLDSCMQKFTEGMALADFCGKKLGAAEKKIEILMRKDAAGTADWQPFATPSAENA